MCAVGRRRIWSHAYLGAQGHDLALYDRRAGGCGEGEDTRNEGGFADGYWLGDTRLDVGEALILPGTEELKY